MANYGWGKFAEGLTGGIERGLERKSRGQQAQQQMEMERARTAMAIKEATERVRSSELDRQRQMELDAHLRQPYRAALQQGMEAQPGFLPQGTQGPATPGVAQFQGAMEQMGPLGNVPMRDVPGMVSALEASRGMQDYARLGEPVSPALMGVTGAPAEMTGRGFEAAAPFLQQQQQFDLRSQLESQQQAGRMAGAEAAGPEAPMLNAYRQWQNDYFKAKEDFAINVFTAEVAQNEDLQNRYSELVESYELGIDPQVAMGMLLNQTRLLNPALYDQVWEDARLNIDADPRYEGIQRMGDYLASFGGGQPAALGQEMGSPGGMPQQFPQQEGAPQQFPQQQQGAVPPMEGTPQLSLVEQIRTAYPSELAELAQGFPQFDEPSVSAEGTGEVSPHEYVMTTLVLAQERGEPIVPDDATPEEVRSILLGLYEEWKRVQNALAYDRWGQTVQEYESEESRQKKSEQHKQTQRDIKERGTVGWSQGRGM
jgi:hypothetical protein